MKLVGISGCAPCAAAAAARGVGAPAEIVVTHDGVNYVPESEYDANASRGAKLAAAVGALGFVVGLYLGNRAWKK